jgi:hypothetical protein
MQDLLLQALALFNAFGVMIMAGNAVGLHAAKRPSVRCNLFSFDGCQS